jgi:4-hydroxyphenylacetate 3-monooxygenase
MAPVAARTICIAFASARPPLVSRRARRDVTTHAAFRRGVASLAELYDLQWQRAEDCLFESPTSGRKIARSFQLPSTRAELASVGRAMAIVARHTHGMMGRVPDLPESRAVGVRSRGAVSRAADPRFGANAVRLHEELREADLSLTHSLDPPQANRSVGPAASRIRFSRRASRSETDSGSSCAVAACWPRCRSPMRSWCCRRRC